MDSDIKTNSARQRDWRNSDPNSPLKNLLNQNDLPKFKKQQKSPRQLQSNSSKPGSSKSSAIEKLQVAEPTSFLKFCVILLMHLCRKVLLFDVRLLISINFAILFFISLITDHYPAPATYFSMKSNVLNQFFVKIGWGWTCFLLSFFIYFTSTIYCCKDNWLVLKHLFRLIVGFMCWFFSTSFINVVETMTGRCYPNVSLSKEACLMNTAQTRWISFDISGHVFLLLYCLLTISEEVKILNNWDRGIDEALKREDKLGSSSRFTLDEIGIMKSTYQSNTPFIRITVFGLTLLSMLWQLMLISTAIYFHNMPQKIAGAMLATFCWCCSYKVWFKMDISISPGLPGMGRLNFLRST